LGQLKGRLILWIALIANAVRFVVEIVAGIAADSRTLQADALDFLGDAANYVTGLGVAGMALVWRARDCSKRRRCLPLAFGSSAMWSMALP
jgi:Co/Zn/Cd efflux system component